MEDELSGEFYEHHNILVDPKQSMLRIDKFLMHRLQNVSRTKLQYAAEAGSILVNSVAVKSNYRVKPNDVISIVFATPPRDTEIYPENIPLDIKYEDSDLLIVNKPAGLVVHPGFNNFTGTLVNALVYHFENLPTKSERYRPGLVHRIDKDTTGLLVIAKTELAMSHLAKQFYDHSITREYLALIWGEPKEDSGTINLNLNRDPADRRRVKAYNNPEIGKHAITHYEVREKFGFATLVACRLETGRTHQIRAHFSAIGHPLFNDETYGGAMIIKGNRTLAKYTKFIENCFKICNRQALHAHILGFEHPSTHKHIEFICPLPEDMNTVLERFRVYTKSSSDSAN